VAKQRSKSLAGTYIHKDGPDGPDGLLGLRDIRARAQSNPRFTTAALA
jgi:hypothetical protein